MTGVLIVDDSNFARLTIAKQLGKDPDIKILGYAKDGIEAIEKVKELKPDVVTLDIEMPRMNGLKTLEHIMTEDPTPVVMLSSYAEESSDYTIQALEIGAVDFFLKPSLTIFSAEDSISNNLAGKVRAAADIDINKLKRRKPNVYRRPVKQSVRLKLLSSRSKVIVIGSSTGGPDALYRVIPKLPADIPAAILIVQHMPPVFTGLVAKRLNEISNIQVKESAYGDDLLEGLAILAKGGSHMTVSSEKKILLDQRPPVLGIRPSVNFTMQSVAKVFGPAATGIVLTGMGSDGTEGAAAIKKAGGSVFAQDENTSVIYGMPRSVYEAGYADRVISLNDMAAEIVSHCSE